MSSIEENVRKFSNVMTPTHRYASFDYCFNYFQARRDTPTSLLGDSLEQSCNQLGFYLASWGMLRGSSFLLQQSMRHFVPIIESIAIAPRELWELDLDGYDRDGIDLLLEWTRIIRDSFQPDPAGTVERFASDTLVTKTMLGVFGCVPAFDKYFKKGFRVSTYSAGSLKKLGDFYRENETDIDSIRQPTIDFATGQPTRRLYTRAKVVDMAFFVAGT